MCFQLQPFSRLMSSSFSVRSDRFMGSLLVGTAGNFTARIGHNDPGNPDDSRSARIDPPPATVLGSLSSACRRPDQQIGLSVERKQAELVADHRHKVARARTMRRADRPGRVGRRFDPEVHTSCRRASAHRTSRRCLPCAIRSQGITTTIPRPARQAPAAAACARRDLPATRSRSRVRAWASSIMKS